MYAGNGLLSAGLVYSERRKQKGNNMYQVVTRYKDGTKDCLDVHTLELAMCFFRSRVAIGNLEAVLGRHDIAWVLVMLAGELVAHQDWSAKVAA